MQEDLRKQFYSLFREESDECSDSRSNKHSSILVFSGDEEDESETMEQGVLEQKLLVFDEVFGLLLPNCS